MHAKPQSNGNSAADFVSAYSKLTAAQDALRVAISALRQNVMHGRNYQHLVHDGDAQVADLEQLSELNAALERLDLIQEDIVAALA